MQMPISKVAQLARLHLSPEEAAAFEAELDAILAYVAQLDALDLTGVPPTSHAVPLQTPFRDDVAAEPLPRAAALANAPETDGEAFVVPRVV